MTTSSGKTMKFRRYAYHPNVLEKKMPIKVEVKNDSKHQEYPCLMQHSPTGAIVLLDSPTSGMVVAPSVGRPTDSDPMGQICTGFHSCSWSKIAFVPWSGEVKLVS